MNSTNLNQKNQSANPALDLQRNQGMIFARRHHPRHDDSNSSVSILCTIHGGIGSGWDWHL